MENKFKYQKKIVKEDVIPWERQPGESEKLFDYFCIYRDMGPSRTIQRVADATGRAYVTMNLHSQKWNWINRAKAWADEKDRERRETIIREVREMAKRHTQESLIFQKCLILPAEAINHRIKTGKIKDFNSIPLERLFDKMIKAAHEFSSIIGIERMSRGEPNEIVKSDLTSGGEKLESTVNIIVHGSKSKLIDENNE
ncbi:MAG: hypothetical protein M1419_09690 [Bacteroidetes bacterium]|nr:hypothetical protein [Bacteroidota bacterium]